ncbi:MAG: Isopentenyl-diphosphate delta-isomerase, FMN-dependent [Myxococcaceae bacterium]|nr:Isopentenyl-diphosphate delta-isomerase, FMN-dependent [Myxococcaceae bacterium]
MHDSSSRRPPPGSTGSSIQRRKDDHLDLCATDDVAFKGATTLLECVQLVHQSLPDIDVDKIDTRVSLLGKTLRLPIVIAAMTGGTERAAAVNRDLASIAEARGLGFGLGSQRAMQRQPNTAWTYQVREWAPKTLVLGNVGVVQARDWQSAAIAEMVREIGADALCVHLNPAQEVVQPGGDRDFERGTDTFKRLVAELPVPVVGKETGCGISLQTARKLKAAGVRTVDTSGAGGTSWVGVETLRAEGDQARLGNLLWDWGIPTAAAVHNTVSVGLETIATGGIQTGLDIVRALALGATAAGIARPMLQAHVRGGKEAAEAFVDQLEREIRAVMLLVGAANVQELRTVPRLIFGPLREWMELSRG